MKIIFSLIILSIIPSLFLLRITLFLTNNPPTNYVLVNFSSCNPKTEAILSWNTAIDNPTELWIGINSNNLTSYPTINNSDATGIGKIHRIHLRNLSPGQKYYYKNSLNGLIGSFTTAPAIAGSDFHTLLVSDTQYMYFNGFYERIAKIIGKDKEQAFFMIAGDLVGDGTSQASWNYFLEKSRPWISTTPLVPVGGNNDKVHDPQSYYWDYIGTETVDSYGKRSYYAFNWSNALFVCMEIANGEHENMLTPLQADQLNWLEFTLANGMHQDFRIVMFHRPIFAPSNSGIVSWITFTTVVPILEAYNVSLVIYGHDHVYGRYRYNNITYLCQGCGGGLINQFIYIPSQDQINQELLGLEIERLSLVPSVTKLEFSNKTLIISTTSVDNIQFDTLKLEVSASGHLTKELS